MKRNLKSVFSLLAVMILLVAFTACGSSKPCEICGDTPAKGYKNTASGEKEYYCEDCSSDCAFCSDDATTHYTGGLGSIIFACDDCYEYIESLNS